MASKHVLRSVCSRCNMEQNTAVEVVLNILQKFIKEPAPEGKVGVLRFYCDSCTEILKSQGRTEFVAET